MSKKFCKDCKHFLEMPRFHRNSIYMCKLFTKIDLVTGDVSYMDCETARQNLRLQELDYEGPADYATCGKAGAFYERKEIL